MTLNVYYGPSLKETEGESTLYPEGNKVNIYHVTRACHCRHGVPIRRMVACNLLWDTNVSRTVTKIRDDSESRESCFYANNMT